MGRHRSKRTQFIISKRLPFAAAPALIGVAAAITLSASMTPSPAFASTLSRHSESAGQLWKVSNAQLLAAIQQIPLDREAAIESARIRIDLEARGLPIGPIDLLIAGTAVSRGAVLVTNNTKEFSRIKGLRLSDWTK